MRKKRRYSAPSDGSCPATYWPRALTAFGIFVFLQILWRQSPVHTAAPSLQRVGKVQGPQSRALAEIGGRHTMKLWEKLRPATLLRKKKLVPPEARPQLGEDGSPLALEQQAALWQHGRGSTGSCNGSCILEYVRQLREPLDPAWVLDLTGSEDEVLALDDDSSCKGQCTHRGFCRQGQCRCIASYGGARCADRARLPFNIQTLPEAHLLTRARAETSTRQQNPKQTPTGDGAAFAVSDEVRRALPDQDYLESRLYDRCALVQGGERLRDGAFGEDIDSHDMVMRFDSTPTKGHERHVGRRTSLRLVGPAHPAWHEAAEVVLQQVATSVDADVYAEFVTTNPGAPLFLLDPGFVRLLSGHVGTNPTTPALGALLALHLCHRVDLYGYPSLHDAQPLDVKNGAADTPASDASAAPPAMPQQAASGGNAHEEDWLAELVAAGLLHVADLPVDVASHTAQTVQ